MVIVCYGSAHLRLPLSRSQATTKVRKSSARVGGQTCNIWQLSIRLGFLSFTEQFQVTPPAATRVQRLNASATSLRKSVPSRTLRTKPAPTVLPHEGTAAELGLCVKQPHVLRFSVSHVMLEQLNLCHSRKELLLVLQNQCARLPILNICDVHRQPFQPSEILPEEQAQTRNM